MARGRNGYSLERLTTMFYLRLVMMGVGLLACGAYIALRPPELALTYPNALDEVGRTGAAESGSMKEAKRSDAAFERDVLHTSAAASSSLPASAGGMRSLSIFEDDVYPTKDDDDKGVGTYDPDLNPDGWKTCRSLGQEEICRGFGVDSCKKLDPGTEWMIIFVVIGLFYLFIGIAILCDELFVPALEVIADKWELSNDVAGATLMAAGGSAPELATSMVGTFQRSDVGFGTIVGSAVFNVLFVIGMCAMFTPKQFEPLALTWWPLARDCTYYVLTLITLVLFMMDGKIWWWEAMIQFFMYLGYVLLMKNSEKLELYFKGGDKAVAPAPEDKEATVEGGTVAGGASANSDAGNLDPNADFTRPSTFRAGILQLLTSKTDVTETAGVACVARIKGDVNQVFNELDKNGNGLVDPDELKTLLLNLGTKPEDVTDESVLKAVKTMDRAGTGQVTKEEFVVWYTQSEERIKNQTKEMFVKFDTNLSGTIDKSEVNQLLRSLGNTPTDEEVTSAVTAMGTDANGEVSLQSFEEWYQNSLFWTQQKQAAAEAAESCQSMWDGVTEGFSELGNPDVPLRAKVVYMMTLPLTFSFCLIPDCRPPGKEHLCYFTFLGSIVFVGILAIVMVELAAIFGHTLGIPEVVMGLTILAAGTSVPDLLSSVIVAKQGQGDMAVSSSIGSNIFDVAVGLPVPWLIFSIIAGVSECNCGVIVGGGGEDSSLVESLVVLLCMVAAIIIAIKLSDWKMTKQLGYSMFFGYFLFVAFSLIRTPSNSWTVAECTVPFEFRPI